MDTTAPTRLALRLADLARVLAELDGTSKAELKAAIEAMYVPKLPATRGIAGAAPLDTQLEGTATDAEGVARECDEAVTDYDLLAKRAAVVLRSPVLKALGTYAEDGKKKAQERREECERVAADARAEIARRQTAREAALAELEQAQQAAAEVERIKQELASLRATFA